MFMQRKIVMLCLAALAFVATVRAQEGPVPKGVPRLDHVFEIMMENHGYIQIVGNPNAPFANQLANSANTAKNYFAIAQSGLRLPCLNHACDTSVEVMSDLFVKDHNDHDK